MIVFNRRRRQVAAMAAKRAEVKQEDSVLTTTDPFIQDNGPALTNSGLVETDMDHPDNDEVRAHVTQSVKRGPDIKGPVGTFPGKGDR